MKEFFRVDFVDFIVFKLKNFLKKKNLIEVIKKAILICRFEKKYFRNFVIYIFFFSLKITNFVDFDTSRL